MATLKDIAQEAEVSVDTVSRVLGNKNKEQRPSSIRQAERIRRIANDLGYRPFAMARATRTGTTGQIGMLVRNSTDRPLHHLSAYETILGINATLSERGLVGVLVPLDEMSREIKHQSRLFHEKLLDGMVVVGLFLEWAEDLVRSRMQRCVWVDSNVEEPRGCIRQLELESGRMVATRMAEAGYRHLVCLGFLQYEHTHYSSLERLAGIEAAAKEFELTVSQPTRAENLMLADPCCSTNQLQALRNQICERDTGVIAYNATYAQRLVHRMRALDLLPGRDFGLASCDTTATIDSVWPDLSRVYVDHYAMGRRAGEMICDGLNEEGMPRSEVVRGRWIEGATLSRS